MSGNASDHIVKTLFWWLCLFVGPAVLIAVELFHPSGFTASPGMYQSLSHAEPPREHSALAYFGPQWWFTLHMIQTPMVGLVALGLWLMVEGIGAREGTVAMVAAWGRAPPSWSSRSISPSSTPSAASGSAAPS